MNRISFVFLLLVFFPFSNVTAQNVAGCTDTQANNFDPQANVQDGSCMYGITIYNPPFKYKLPDEINETSGLIYFRNELWTINDSGNEPILYCLDIESGEVVQRIKIGDATNKDWEDLAQDENYIYIGDFGNNSGNRKLLDIYRVSKKSIPLEEDAEVQSDKIVFQYPDYKGNIEKKKENNFDCEAFVVVDDSIHLFSKNWGNQQTKHYRIPKTPGNYVADLLFTFDSRGLITAADYNPTTNELVLLGYTKNEWVPFMWLLFDFQDNSFFSGNKRRIDMLNIFATQTEGICYTNGRNGVITSEGNRTFTQTAYDFTNARWTQSETKTETEVPMNSKDIDFVLSPNPLEKSKLEIIFKNSPVGQFQVELYEESGTQIHLKKYKMSREDGVKKIKLKLGFLKPGNYFIRVGSGDVFIDQKFTKE